MRALIQRVIQADVKVTGTRIAEINHGMMVLLGVEAADDPSDVEWLADKIFRLRIFADADGKMNRSVSQVGGNILVVSQFTLHASTQRGNRPSFLKAALPDHAEPMIAAVCEKLSRLLGKDVAQGIFGADMKIGLINDGPVTIFIDSRARE